MCLDFGTNIESWFIYTLKFGVYTWCHLFQLNRDSQMTEMPGLRRNINKIIV